MSPTNLKQLASSIPATVGIEFELCVRNMQSEENYKPDYTRNEEIDPHTFEDLILNFYDNGDIKINEKYIRKAISDSMVDYEEWCNEQWELFAENKFFDWFDKNTKGIENPNRRQFYVKFVTKYQDAFLNKNCPIIKWMRSFNLMTMKDFHDIYCKQYKIKWPYVLVNSLTTVDPDEMVKSFSKSVQMPVDINRSYHDSELKGFKKRLNAYTLETDPSILPNKGDGGWEFVSPPLPLKDMIQDLFIVTRWATENDCYTNQSCGLHINVSIDGVEMDNLDYIKLILLSGDDYVLNQFQRIGNDYAQSAMRYLKSNIDDEKSTLLMKKMRQKLNLLASQLFLLKNEDRRTSINVNSNRIEFRSPGGDWLSIMNNNPDMIVNSILRYVVALDAAMDETKYRDEYLKKLYKLFSQNDKFIEVLVNEV